MPPPKAPRKSPKRPKKAKTQLEPPLLTYNLPPGSDDSTDELHDSATMPTYLAHPPSDTASGPVIQPPIEKITQAVPPPTIERDLSPYLASAAQQVLSAGQVLFLRLTAALMLLLFYLAPDSFLFGCIALGQFVYCYLTAHKSFFFRRGKPMVNAYSTLEDDWKLNSTSQLFAELDAIYHSDNAPYYTILLPVYKEGEIVLRSLVKNIDSIIYPRDKLQVIIAIEQHDEITGTALSQLDLPPCFTVVRVPPGQPQTKGRASNYALKFSLSDYLVIYDAEDKPDPYQLLKAVRCFQKHAASQLHKPRHQRKYLSCVQARLNFYNKNESIVSSFFALEYAMQFNYIMPAMSNAKVFLPLGGTSNHFTARALLVLQGWDIYNVTEDADIGVRIALLGWEVAMINSCTMEEAPIDTITWVKQRTRWFKGHMQTFLVHLRQPANTYRKLGAKSFLNFFSLMGIATFGAVLTVPALITCLVSMLYKSPFTDFQHKLIIYTTIISLLSWLVTLYTSFERVRRDLGLRRWILLILPFYFILHLIAVFRALIQLISKPHYWDKTQHGTSKMYDDQQP